MPKRRFTFLKQNFLSSLWIICEHSQVLRVMLVSTPEQGDKPQICPWLKKNLCVSGWKGNLWVLSKLYQITVWLQKWDKGVWKLLSYFLSGSVVCILMRGSHATAYAWTVLFRHAGHRNILWILLKCRFCFWFSRSWVETEILHL